MNIFWALIYVSEIVSWVLFFGSAIGLICAAYLALRHRLYRQAVFLAVTTGFPAASYIYSYVNGTILSPVIRKAEVASWRRVSITHDNRPRVFIDTWGSDGWVAKTLVALGKFERTYGWIGDEWYYFERTPGATCAETRYDVRIRLREYAACVSATKTGRRMGFRS